MNPWLHAMRPKTLIAVVTPVGLSSLLSIRAGYFTFWVFVTTLLCGILVQIATNFANDYFDFIKGTDTKERIGPTKVLQLGLISLKQMQIALSVCLVAISLLSIPLILRGGFFICLLTLVSIALSIGYTAGPFPLSYLGIADIFVIIFFGPIATCTTYFLQCGSISSTSIIVGLILGFLANGLLVVNNMRDYSQDAKANKKTLVVRFGLQFGLMELALCYCIPFILTISAALLLSSPYLILANIGLLPAVPMLTTIKKNPSNPEKIAPFLQRAALCLLLYFAAFSILLFI